MNIMREMKDIRQIQMQLLEIKNRIFKMKFPLDRINSKLVPVLQKERPVNLSQCNRNYKMTQREKNDWEKKKMKSTSVTCGTISSCLATL